MFSLKKRYAKLPVLLFDTVSIPVAWYLAFWFFSNLRLVNVDGMVSRGLPALIILTMVQLACFYYFKVHKGLWRFSSIKDVTRILKAAVTATVLTIPLLYLTSFLQTIPRSIFPLYNITLVSLLCGARLFFRNYWDSSHRAEVFAETKRVLIIGAGQAGEGLVRDLKRTHTYVPVGFVDDNVSKRGLDVHGVPILGTVRDLVALVANHRVDLIFIAIPSARSASMRRIVDACELCNIPFRTLPSLSALASGRVEVNALRQVNIEDLLGRDQVQLDWEKIGASICGKRVLVTGGGGSIGSELCRQIIALQPEALLILDNSEFNLYEIEMEFRKAYPKASLQFVLQSVVDRAGINYVFKRFRPSIIFHAAAYKHVPLLEEQIRVAVQNNVLGTKLVAEASVAVGAEKFVLISSDKAVNPTNVMGTTKRVAEIYCQNLNTRVPTQFITVRFGNVLGSVGSIVPLFNKQLQSGGPLTVTHKDMQRYFMTISEASQLILQAMANGLGGEIFVLDMGEPIKINYLAEQMIRLAGKEPGRDISIEYIGLRPGEKLYEELFHDAEQLLRTEHNKLLKANFRQIDWKELLQAMHLIDVACEEYQEGELLVLLKNIVPEFQCGTMVEV